MRRIKKRGLATVTVKRNPAYLKDVDDNDVITEEIVEEVVEETVEPAGEKVEEATEAETVAEVAEIVEPAEEPAEELAEVSEELAEAEEPAEENAEENTEADVEIVEDVVTVNPDGVVFDEAEKPVEESEEEDVREAVAEEEAEESATDESTEVDEEAEEVPLEASEEEAEEILNEEGSLDGTEEEAKALSEQIEETAEAEETAEETVEEPAEDEDVEAGEEAEEPAATDEAEKTEEKPEKETFKLTAPADMDDILAKICVKRGRKLIYRPNEILYNCTAAVIGTDKNNEEGIKVKNILDEEIKQGVKLGYIDKYDGLKMSEIKEEYENDVVYEYAEQEFKRVGLVLDGDKIKVYVYDWDMKALHHVGYVEQSAVAELKPYLENRDNYSFDVCGLITGGKFRKVIKDEATGKVTVEKGNDGKLGVELDVSVINRKD